MSISYYPPGSRKGNKFFVAIIKAGGRRKEIGTKALTKTDARRVAEAVEREMLIYQVPRAGAVVTFAEAARRYAAFKQLDLDAIEALTARQREDAKRIHKLIAVLGKERLRDISHATLVNAANRLHGHHTAQTKNREVMTPAASILHYAAKNGWCAWLRVDLFKQPKPKTRAVSFEVASALIEAAPEGPKRRLLLWLFRQGTRISDTLRVSWADIDLTRGTVRLHISKTDTWTEHPLAAEMVEELAAIPPAQRSGWLFPWRDPSSVRCWLTPLAQQLGLHFTPHMARHSLGTWLSQDNATLRTIMQTLGHADAKSSLRYQGTDIETVRAASARLPRLRGVARPQGRVFITRPSRK